LWNDLVGARDEHEQAVGEVAEQNAEYFLGPIVVVNPASGSSGIAHVVDGQQRLTSLHALLWCAYARLRRTDSQGALEKKEELRRLLLTVNNESSLMVAREDQANLLALRENAALDDTTPLGRNGAFLRDQIERLPSHDDLISLLEYILNKVQFVFVETESFASAWDLFIGLNGKGRPLTPADLIKAFVCGNSRDSTEMANIWAERVLPLGNDGTSALLDTVRVGTGDVGSEAKLFRMFEKAWQKPTVTPNLLSDAVRNYGVLWHLPLDQVLYLYPEVDKRAMRGLRLLGRRDHTPILLAIAYHYGTPAVMNTAVLRALEAYQLWMAATGKRGRERSFTALYTCA
jgi:hypothetical protein